MRTQPSIDDPRPTKLQLSLLTAMLDMTLRNGYQPSSRELAKRFRFKSLNSVHQHFKALARHGYVEELEGKRAVRMLRLPNGEEFRGFQLKESAR